ncbi:MAG: AAA family ATPase [Gemmatimonadota bacterium]
MGAPFSTQQIARSEYFTDREREVARVVEAMRGRDRLVLYGERRMGKSSIIERAAELVRSGGGVVLTANAWTITDLDDLNRGLMQAVPGDWLLGDRIGQLIRALRGMVVLTADDSGRPTLQLTGRPPRDSAPQDRFREILRQLDVLAADHEAPVVVVIDEFQRLEDAHPGGGAILRDIVQEASHLAFVFAGSIVGLVMDLLGPKGAFHAIDRIEVRAIAPEHLKSWVQHRLATHGTRITAPGMDRLYELAGPVTEYVVRLAKDVHRMGRGRHPLGPSEVERAFEEVLGDTAGTYELVWDRLATGKRQVLRAIADGHQQLASREVIEDYGIGSSSAVSYAVDQLRRDGHLAPGKPYRISDPFFAAWVRRQP